MTEEQKRAEVVRYWWERAHTSLKAARCEAAARDYPPAINRPGPIEAEWAAVLAREPDRRLLADESLHVLWGPEASSRLVEVAQASIQRIQEYLVSVGIALG